MYLPGVACILLLLVCGGMGLKIYFMRKAADEIRRQCALRLEEDTNVGIDISSRDGKMLALAADLDGQMKKLRRTRLKYEEGDAELKRAVTNISHDLRTPLTALSGYMQLLEKEEVPSRVREHLDIMDDRILAMTRLTEELFQYSVIVSPDKRKEREAVCLGEKKITPQIHIPEEKVVVLASRDALSRVFGNIISNAVKYSDGDLRITLYPEGRVTFANHAGCLDEVEAAKLFERFYTVESGRESTGLGLSIARTLTEQMGGSIGAYREDGEFVIWVSFLQAEERKGKSV